MANDHLKKLIDNYGRACVAFGTPAWESKAGEELAAALTSPVAPEQVVAEHFIGYLCRAWGETEHPSAELVRDLAGVRRFMVREWLGEEDATDYDGTPTLPAIMEEIEGRDWRGEGEWHIEFEIGGVSVEQVFGTAITAAPEAAPAAPLVMQDENSGRDGRRYNEWHASRLNAREAAAATPAAPSAEASPDDDLLVACIALNGATLTVEVNALADMFGTDDEQHTYELTFKRMTRAAFEALGEFNGF